jgi:molybdate transport system substrate-binding protein
MVAVAMLACSAPADDGETLTVFAASSLAVAFEDIAARFESSRSDVEVAVSLAGSQTLATQIVNGAQPDVFASADAQQMNRAVEAAPADMGPQVFATNRLVIVVAEGNPKGIESVADLARDDLVVALGAEEVPVGRYTRRVLAAAGVEVRASSYEPNVGLVLTKVSLGEVDAGVVYQSDLSRADEGIEAVVIPADINVTARYPIAGWDHGRTRALLVEDFIEFVASRPGQDELLQAGFQP